MHKYCKAYPLGALRQYPDWQEYSTSSASELTDTTIVYLRDDFIVVESPVLEQGNLFDNVTPEWQEFCKQTLQFSIPEDLHYAYQAE